MIQCAGCVAGINDAKKFLNVKYRLIEWVTFEKMFLTDYQRMEEIQDANWNGCGHCVNRALFGNDQPLDGKHP